MKLNLGCGAQVPAGWVNVDYALGARLAKIPAVRQVIRRMGLFETPWDPRIVVHDLTRPFPWSDSTADVIYASHILEHLSKDDGRRFLGECHRVLRTDGILRLLVPDLRAVVTEYVERRLPADGFLDRLGVLPTPRPSALKNRLAPFVQYPHRCMYDAERLLEIIEEVGFRARCRGPFDSDIERVAEVELEGRTVDAVIVEARRRPRGSA